MNSQIPLKRIAIGVAATLASTMLCTLASTADSTKAYKGTTIVLYEAEGYHTGAYAPSTEVNQEEPEEYEYTDWQKFDLNDYQSSDDLSALLRSIETTSAPPAEETTIATTVETTPPPPPPTQPVITDPPPTTTIALPTARPVAQVAELQPSTFYFTSYGYGHGVGMSQNGANYYSNYAGYNYLQILNHYYPGTVVGNSGTAATETISVRGYRGSVVDVISRVCNAEIGPSFNVEAIKAQAVAAYTFVKYSGGSTSGMAINTSTPPAKIVEAVQSVLGQAIYYNGNFILAQFYASSGGVTSSCKDVFHQDLPYLRSIPCDFDATCDPYYGNLTTIPVDRLRNLIQKAFKITLSEDYSNWIQIVEGDGGIVAYVVVDGQKTIKGYDFARAIGLISPNFAISFS